MALRRPLNIAAAASAIVSCSLMASPASANDGSPIGATSTYAPDRDARERWVDECSGRLAAGYHHQRREDRLRERDRAQETCANYYDDYYAYYQIAPALWRAAQRGDDPSYASAARGL